MGNLLVIIGIILFAVQLSKAEVLRNETNICTGMQPYVLFRDVTNCSRYLFCNEKGQLTVWNCIVGYSFNATALKCAQQHGVRCFACPKNESFVDLPVDHNCHQFIRCFGGVPRQYSCAQDLLFDPVRRQCNLRKDVTCACPQEDIPTRPYFIHSRNNCGSYEVCHNGTRIQRECAEGLNFNLEMLQCDVANQVNCNATSLTGY